jgi:arabinofuranan 3-O-arabinosyltransferase
VTTLLPPRAPEQFAELAEAEYSVPAPRRAPSVGSTRRSRSFVRAHAIGCAIVASAASAAAIVSMLWFRTGSMYARGDVGPFVRDSLRSELSGMWTHQNTGAGGPTYEIVRSVEILAIDIAHVLGGGDALGQRLLFAAIFAFAASGVAALAARFTARPWLVAWAGLLGAFNPLVMINLPNFLIPMCIGIVGWFAALAVDAAGSRDAGRPRRLALVTIAVAYLSSNPPLLGVVAVITLTLPALAAMLTGTGLAGARRCTAFLARAAAWSIPLALWWLVPYVTAVRTASVSGTIGANTDVFAWSWTQAHSTLDRVIALVAKWSWPDAKYGEAASVVGAPMWLWLSFALPLALCAAPLVAAPARRRAALWLVTCAMGIALVAKGLNSPLRDVNSFAYRHVPGMWLLREPMTKVGPLLALASVAGWVLTIDGLARGRRRIGDLRMRTDRWRRVMLVGLFLAPLIFAWPMFTGAVVQGHDRVTVPAAWRQVARIVNRSAVGGKALVLPLDDFYQVPTTWGFYGTDTLPTQLFTRPTLARNPQAYIGASPDLDALIRSVETGLASGETTAVPGALHKLGVSQVVVRKDIDYESPIRTVDMVRPAPLLAGLADVAGVHQVAATQVADVFEVDGGAAPVSALSGTVVATDLQGDALASVVASSSTAAGIVTTPANASQLVRGRAWYLDVNAPRAIAPPAAGVWQYSRRAGDTPLLELAPDPRGAVMREPVSIEVDGAQVARRPDVVVPGAGRAVAVQVDGAITDLSSGDSYARIAYGAHAQTFSAGVDEAITSWGPVKDCNRYNGLSLAAAGLRADTVAMPAGNTALRLQAQRHSACVSASVGDAQPGNVIRVSVAQRAVRGAAPRMCMWLSGRNNCAALNWSARPDGEWFEMSAVTRLPADAGSVRMFLYADAPADTHGPPTEVWYRDVRVEQLVPGPPTTIAPSPLPTGRLTLPRKPISVATQLRLGGASVGAPSEVGNCARTSGRSLSDLGISSTPSSADGHPGVTLRASHDSACVSFPVFGLHRDVTYEVAFEASASDGATPRLCLWEDSAGRCATLDLVSGPHARGTYRYRGRVDPDASAWRLFFYADAPHRAARITYDNIRLRPVADEALVLQPTDVGSANIGGIRVDGARSDAYHVHVENARAPFVLALNESYAKDWTISGLPRDATATHIRLDGYRNGWAIDARGDLDLVLRYAPARTGHLAMRVSEVTLVVLVVSLLAAPALTRRRRRWKARRAHVRRPGPRRVVLPDSWPTTAG